MALKVLGRIIAVLLAAVVSVVAVQRLVRKLYTDVGKKYIAIDQEEESA